MIVAPPTEGEYVAVGDIQFGPGQLLSAEHLHVIQKPSNTEVPIAILDDSVRWSDDSLITVELAFPTSSAEVATSQYWAEIGEKRTQNFDREKSSLPTIAFAVGDPPPETPLEDSAFAGVLTVHVVEDSAAYYWYSYWCLVPITGILGLLVWRKIRLWRSGGSR